MTRFLLAAMPAAGHIGPLLPIARELAGRGHEVAWYTGSRVRRQVEATGARYLPHVHARDLDVANLNAELPGRADKKGFAQFRFDMRELFIAAVPDQVQDLEAYVAGASGPTCSSPSRAWPGPAPCSRTAAASRGRRATSRS